MHDLITSDEFNRYQVKLIGEMNRYIKSLMGGHRYEEVKGAMGLARMVIRFPANLVDEETAMKAMYENINRFQSNFIREAVEGDE